MSKDSKPKKDSLITATQQPSKSISPFTIDETANRLVEQAMNDLAAKYGEGKVDPVVALQTALGSQKVQTDVWRQRAKIKQEMEGYIPADEAAECARTLCDGFCDSIESVAESHGLNGRGFLVEVIEHRDRVIEETVLARAHQNALKRMEG